MRGTDKANVISAASAQQIAKGSKKLRAAGVKCQPMRSNREGLGKATLSNPGRSRMADIIHSHGASQFHIISAGLTPAYGRNGEHLGALVATLVHARSGETQFAVLAIKGDLRQHTLVPVPWAILDRYRKGETCIADADRRKLMTAPHFTEAELDRFDTDLAAHIDGAYGLEFPGIETLNDLA
jgi:hypothetical protein